MRIAIGVAAFALLAMGGAWAGTPAPAIQGDYLEVRSCDVYTAACFANSEVGLTGEEAVMAWSVDQGAFQGESLDGLKVVAVIRANDTLGNVTTAHEGRGVLLVDERATASQREALVALARAEAGTLLNEVVRVETAPIQMAVHEQGHGIATLVAGTEVTIETRCLTDHDKHCGNDEAYYPPLTRVENAMAAFTQLDRFTGDGLGITWDDSGRRSAYLATFAR